MYGQNEGRYQDWVAEQWAGEDPAQDRDEASRWTKVQWVGDQGYGPARHQSAAQMPEGARGLSGFRHTSPATHWVPAH
jgi:hypothetical protein